MNWSGKMWALQYPDGRLRGAINSLGPVTFVTRQAARDHKSFWASDAKVVRVQVDVRVIE